MYEANGTYFGEVRVGSGGKQVKSSPSGTSAGMCEVLARHTHTHTGIFAHAFAKKLCMCVLFYENVKSKEERNELRNIE